MHYRKITIFKILMDSFSDNFCDFNKITMEQKSVYVSYQVLCQVTPEYLLD